MKLLLSAIIPIFFIVVFAVSLTNSVSNGNTFVELESGEVVKCTNYTDSDFNSDDVVCIVRYSPEDTWNILKTDNHLDTIVTIVNGCKAEFKTGIVK